MITETKCEDCDGEGSVEGVHCLACDGRGSTAQIADEPAPMPDASTPPDERPIVMQLMFPRAEDDERPVEVTCMVCGKPTTIPKYMLDAVKRHNRAERDAADRSANEPYPYMPQYIGNAHITVCTEPGADGEASACVKVMRAQKSAESHAAFREMDRHFGEMRMGQLTSEGATFLRRAGYGDHVTEYLEKQANAAKPKPPEEEKPKGKRRGGKSKKNNKQGTGQKLVFEGERDDG